MMEFHLVIVHRASLTAFNCFALAKFSNLQPAHRVPRVLIITRRKSDSPPSHIFYSHISRGLPSCQISFAGTMNLFLII